MRGERLEEGTTRVPRLAQVGALVFWGDSSKEEDAHGRVRRILAGAMDKARRGSTKEHGVRRIGLAQDPPAVKELCRKYGLNAEELVSVWVAFSIRNDNCQLSAKNVHLIEPECQELGSRKGKREPIGKPIRDNIANDTTADDIDIMLQYCPPENKEGLRRERKMVSKETPSRPGKSSQLENINLNMSSDGTVTQSNSPRPRTVCSFGQVETTSWGNKNSTNQSTVSLYGRDEHSEKKPFKYMYESLSAIANYFSKTMDVVGDEIKSHHNIGEFSPVNAPEHDGMSIIGRICCDGTGKLNPKAVRLEGSLAISEGNSIRLDIDGLNQYSFFPGQIVAFRGTNNTGHTFVCQEQYTGVAPKFSAKSLTIQDSLQLVVAAGPFVTGDNFDQFRELMQYVKESDPHVCILLGPFFNCKQGKIEDDEISVDYNYTALFLDCLKLIESYIKGTRTHVVIVASQKDPHHCDIYPTPPYLETRGSLTAENLAIHTEISQQFHFAPDPCILDIDGVTVGATTNDIIFHLAKEELTMGYASDRISRLLSHLFAQRSFYPLYPQPEGINVAWSKLALAEIKCTPHLLILPSELVNYIKDVHGCCCINPRYTGKNGTFAKIEILLKDQQSTELLVPKIACEIIKNN